MKIIVTILTVLQCINVGLFFLTLLEPFNIKQKKKNGIRRICIIISFIVISIIMVRLTLSNTWSISVVEKIAKFQ